MSQTLREEPRCPLIFPLPSVNTSRLDCAISANAAVGGTANRVALCVVLLGVCAICAEYLCLVGLLTPDTTETAAELIALSNYFD